ncbi:trimethylamine methyltransferase family protein [Haloarculaceae archaeon H-GB2-1]|nr:trimethylamine methyltransferase family protein [Haloarculaceae archaeon H-GB1-1]MEA5409514.1 trimethylamine methyltransferase family protein [Haloarculaceae archaeon H-GB2-1]
MSMDVDLSTQPTPRIDRLGEEGAQAIHDAAMFIIEEYGIQVNHPEALALLDDAGASVDDDNLVTADRSLVEDAVSGAPSSFTLHARNPDNDIEVGGADPFRAPGYGAPNVRTFEDGRRSSTLDDYETFMKLAQLEGPINSAGYNAVEPTDVPQEVKHVEMVKRSLEFTDLPVMVSSYGADRAATTLDMVGVAVDDPDLSKTYAAGLVNTVPPRTLDEKMTGGLLELARQGQASVVAAFIQAGASGPGTMAGAIAQSNAENLMGITIAQLANPGAPVVYGIPSSNLDMRYGSLSIGSPESALFSCAAGTMGEYYDVPSFSGSSLTDAKTVDYQAGFETALVDLATTLGGVDFMLHAAGILESYTAMSPEKFVLDCELLRFVDRFQEGYTIDEERLALDVVGEIEPQEHFLGEPHTLKFAGEDFLIPDLVDKQSHGDWESDGAKTAFELGHDRVQDHLAAYSKPELDSDLQADLDRLASEQRDAILREI